MIRENIAIFPIISLIAAGLISFLSRSKYFNYLISLIGGFAALISCYHISKYLETSEFLQFSLGGWHPPKGIELKIDKHSLFFISFLVFFYIVNILHISLMNRERSIRHLTSLMSFSLAGCVGMASTNDLFNLYVFLEISSICAYSLANFGQNKLRYLSSFEYLIIGSLASCLILLSIGLLYLDNATLNISEIALNLEKANYPRISSLAMVLILMGLIIKSGFFPISSWFVRVYSNSHSFIVSFFSFTSSNIYLFLIGKFIFFFFNDFFVVNPLFKVALSLIGLLSCLVFSIKSLYSKEVREILAFSSISNFGYILLAFSFNDPQSFFYGNLIFYSHLLCKTSLLMITNILEEKLNKKIFFTDLALFMKNCFFSRLIIFWNLFILSALPLSLIFSGKFFILQSLLNARYYLISFLLLCSIFCSFLYMGRILKPYFLGSHSIAAENENFHGNKIILLPAGLLTLLNIFFHLKIEFFTKFISL